MATFAPSYTDQNRGRPSMLQPGDQVEFRGPEGSQWGIYIENEVVLCITGVDGQNNEISINGKNDKAVVETENFWEVANGTKYTDHNTRTLSMLQPGDRVQFHRKCISHWGIYIGNERVIHVTSTKEGKQADFQSTYLSSCSGCRYNKGIVQIDNFWTVAKKSRVTMNNNDKKWQALKPEVIIERAVSKLGSSDYNVFFSNCEHFVNWCRYNDKTSEQVTGKKMQQSRRSKSCFSHMDSCADHNKALNQVKLHNEDALVVTAGFKIKSWTGSKGAFITQTVRGNETEVVSITKPGSSKVIGHVTIESKETGQNKYHSHNLGFIHDIIFGIPAESLDHVLNYFGLAH